jgi:hypothetical protein
MPEARRLATAMGQELRAPSTGTALALELEQETGMAPLPDAKFVEALAELKFGHGSFSSNYGSRIF